MQINFLYTNFFQLVYGGANGQVTQPQSSAQPPVLILQPFGGMQIPISEILIIDDGQPTDTVISVALPYPNSGASFAATVPKQVYLFIS